MKISRYYLLHLSSFTEILHSVKLYLYYSKLFNYIELKIIRFGYFRNLAQEVTSKNEIQLVHLIMHFLKFYTPKHCDIMQRNSTYNFTANIKTIQVFLSGLYVYRFLMQVINYYKASSSAVHIFLLMINPNDKQWCHKLFSLF